LKITVVVIRLTTFVTAFTVELVMTVELSKLLPVLALLQTIQKVYFENELQFT
jgi:hypothetical protein